MTSVGRILGRFVVLTLTVLTFLAATVIAFDGTAFVDAVGRSSESEVPNAYVLLFVVMPGLVLGFDMLAGRLFPR